METPVKFGLKNISAFLKKGNHSSLFVLVDEKTIKHCYPLLKPLLPAHTLLKIKSGEQNKTLETCTLVWQKLLDGGADRHSLLINLGGGVITDIGGFCASVFMRGINFVNIPTTLMAMADAAIGGKTGADMNGIKNVIGSFAMPAMIFIDTTFLTTLPQQQIISGSAEIYKHALLQNKQSVNAMLRSPFSLFTIKEKEALIKKSIAFKTKVVLADSRENNTRKQLNLGHTIGHAMESYFLNYRKPLLHGEAVALGLVAASYLAHRFYNLNYECFLKTVLWYDLNFEKPDLSEMNFNTVLNFMKKDKKNKQSKVRMVLPEKEGTMAYDVEVSNEEILETLKFLLEF